MYPFNHSFEGYAINVILFAILIMVTNANKQFTWYFRTMIAPEAMSSREYEKIVDDGSPAEVFTPGRVIKTYMPWVFELDINRPTSNNSVLFVGLSSKTFTLSNWCTY